MPTAYDVSSEALIDRLAKYIKENFSEVTPPTWSLYAKTGAHAERPPQNPDWWFVRCASLLRKLYIHGPLGVSRLRSFYGSSRPRGNMPKHSVKGGGSAIREPLQQLEKVGLVVKAKKGRTLSKQGSSLLNGLAAEVLKEVRKEESVIQ